MVLNTKFACADSFAERFICVAANNAVDVVPTLLPTTIATAASRLNNCCPANTITKPVVTELDYTIVVAIMPIITPAMG